jgi:murein DD-endopeptidase MepM/ murein hydrolase activator NlpD
MGPLAAEMRVLAALLTTLVLAAQPSTVRVSLTARAQQPGELVVVSIAGAAPTDPVRVRAFDRDVPVYTAGGEWRALVGIDLDVKPGPYAITIDAGSPTRHLVQQLHVERRIFRTRRLTVDEAFVTPPPSEAARIARDARLLESTWASSAGERLWTAPFERPVPEAANSAFGTRSIFNGKPRNAHGGADFLSPSGTPVHAPNAGRVVVARNLYFSGNTVIIDHGLGLFSMLAHLSVLEVAEGNRVDAGHVIGRVGATGRVTGPHLHWAVRAGNARVDPLSLLSVLGAKANAAASREAVDEVARTGTNPPADAATVDGRFW